MGSENEDRPSLEVSFGRSKAAKPAKAAKVPRPPKAAQAGKSPTAAQAGKSPTAAQAGKSPTAAQAGKSPTAAQAGKSPTAAQAGKSPTAAQAAKSPKAARPKHEPKPVRLSEPDPQPDATAAPRVRREKPVRDPKPPRQPYGVVTASVITGLVVGVLLVGAAAGTLRGCAAVRGTSSCGGAGLPLLALLIAAAVVLGGGLLQVLSHTASAMSISFLALAFVALTCCLFLLDSLDGWAAVIIVPVLAAVGYLGSHLVTTRYIEPSDAR